MSAILTRGLRIAFLALVAIWTASALGWIPHAPWLGWALAAVLGALVVQRIRRHRELTAAGAPRQGFT
jgi:membrane protein implicated in regulation of membrane protease activity